MMVEASWEDMTVILCLIQHDIESNHNDFPTVTLIVVYEMMQTTVGIWMELYK